MAPSGLVTVLYMFLLPAGSFAATLHETSLVRREGKSIYATSIDQSLSSEPAANEDQDCPGCQMYDYLLGKPNSNECRHPENETLVTDDIMCRYAGVKRNNAHVDAHNIFVINTDDPNLVASRPHGCFHMQCHPGGDTTKPEQPCYFINEAEAHLSDATHENFTGTPICKRMMYRDGATGAQDGCPDEYTVIKNETLCGEVCGERIEGEDYKCNEFFRIGSTNFSQHQDYPEGCFHLQEAGFFRVYYNSYSTGTTVHGTPMCQVASPMRFADVVAATPAPSPAAAPVAATTAAPSP